MTKPSSRVESFNRWLEAQGTNVSQVAKASGLPYTTIKSFADGERRSMSGENESAIARAFGLAIEEIFELEDVQDEATLGLLPNYLRAWREYRRLEQAELAERVETTEAVINLLENGKQGLPPKWLRRLAPALGTTPGYLLDHDPNDLPTDMLDLWHRVPAADRPRALQALQIFERKK